MKNLIFLVLTLTITSCAQPNEEMTESFFQNSEWSYAIKSDTSYLCFLDTTYTLLTNYGIQQEGSWMLKSIAKEKLLSLGDFCPSTYQIISYTENSCLLERIDKEASTFEIFKLEKANGQILGRWESKISPPTLQVMENYTEQWDSILKDESLWEKEVFEFTPDSIKYSFYGFETAVKFKQPYYQLEKPLCTADGIIRALRPINKEDDKLNLEFILDPNLLKGEGKILRRAFTKVQ